MEFDYIPEGLILHMVTCGTSWELVTGKVGGWRGEETVGHEGWFTGDREIGDKSLLDYHITQGNEYNKNYAFISKRDALSFVRTGNPLNHVTLRPIEEPKIILTIGGEVVELSAESIKSIRKAAKA